MGCVQNRNIPNNRKQPELDVEKDDAIFEH